VLDVVGPAGLHLAPPINALNWLTNGEAATQLRGARHCLANHQIGICAPRMPGKANEGLTETERMRFDVADQSYTFYANALAKSAEMHRSPHYKGPCGVWNEEEARVILSGLLDYFGLGSMYGLPPIDGWVPGMSSSFMADDETWILAHAGVDYLKNALEGRTRRQYNILTMIRRMLNESYHRGRKDLEDEWMATETSRCANEAEEQFSSQPDDDRPVYFIGDVDGDIKIGVSGKPHERLRTLQINHPGTLSILALTTGGRDAEREYHQRFAEYRRRGEWFERHPDILAEIERLSA